VAMRYLVKARVKPGREGALLRAIESGELGRGSVAGGEYLDNMEHARLGQDGTAHWVEVCFCATPLAESVRTGRSTSSCSVCVTRMPGEIAGTSTARSVGVLRLRLHETAGGEIGTDRGSFPGESSGS
jgi:hypothetical protein